MNKFVELLEQHCQWIAISLGGLFFAWIVWGYLLTSPVALEAPGRDALTPGNVDDEVARAADQLQKRIDSQTVKMPSVIASKDPIKEFDELMAGRNVPVMARVPWNSQGFDPLKVEDKGDNLPELVKVDKLPAVPPAEVLPDLSLKVGRVTVAPVPGAPGQPAPAAAPGVLPVDARDISYIRGEYRIDPTEIAQEFSKVNVPAGLPTMVVGVEVWRQEKKLDGTWTNAEKVPLIKNNIVPWPLPAANADFQQVGQFQAWAESPQGQADLLRPAFYQVLMGEGPWDAPQNLDAARDAATAAAAAERDARLEENRRKQDELRQRRQNTPPPEDMMPPEGRRGRRGREEYQAADPTRPSSLADLAGLQLAQARPPMGPGGRPLYPEEMPIPDEAGGFMQPPGGGMPGGQPGAPGQPAAGALPAAVFVPQGAPAIIGWFFDETVVEGRTYRYQVRYAIKNPMWMNNQVANPALAQQFALWSELKDDEWSEERTVETSTRFFLANASWQTGSVPNTVRVEIFKWAGGRWQSRVFQTSVGDRIGWEEAGVKFNTNSMLVDVRFDDRLERAYVLVLGPDGRLTEREPITDRNDPDRAALQLLVKNAQPPAMGAAGGPGAPVAGR